MPRSKEAQKARDAQRSALLKEARSLRDSGGKITPEHQAELDRYDRKSGAKKQRYSAATSEILSGKDKGEISPTLSSAVKRVSERNPGLIKEVTAIKEAPNIVKAAVRSVVPDNRYTEALSTEPRQTKLNPINNDTRHHSVLTTIADKLGDKLDAAESKGVWNNHYEKAATHLADSHAFNDMSLQSHNYGDVEGAKRHFQTSANSLIAAHANLHNRQGVSLAPGIPNYITTTVRDYVHSTTPGVGAKPHNDFVARVLKERTRPQSAPVVKETAPKAPVRPINSEELNRFVSDIPENPKAITTVKSPRERAEMRSAVAKKLAEQKGKRVSEFNLSSASRNVELERPEIDTSSIGKEPGFSGSQMIGQQLSNWAKGANY